MPRRSLSQVWDSIADRGLSEPDWHRDEALAESLREPLLKLCARYLIKEKRDGEPLDPVARFHLGNGARIELAFRSAAAPDQRLA